MVVSATGMLLAGLVVHADECKDQTNGATQLGEQVLAIRIALDNTDAPDAMQAIKNLGLDSRYYVMVRGWLSLQLQGDRNFLLASQGKITTKLEQRIDFLERAIRTIDLE